MIQINRHPKRGFALLITLLTVGVIISATLAIIELSRLQLKISVDSRDAEVAFSAANAAKECAQYIRTTASSAIRNGNQISSTCLEKSFNTSRSAPLGFGVSAPANGSVWRYQYDIDWTVSGSARCSAVDMIVVYADTGDITIGGSGSNSLQTVISNYRTSNMTCIAGSECTIIAASGYNSTCANRNTLGVLKREVLLEF